ncbi:bifunctional folylpolyglutamate synthase/dihydrofolate synthase [Herbiconiux sp. CPCC 203407]|uniref:tetrahydrofolate synthase n=1 Tax=Herbiconiux oxytropis TaxID=2970915 RepID=A0AA41XH56_9MICO|nr:folylpolyglutamate synthase/dihydrofolate synthase family protein [Herbiconiux oxytropis]MCS5722613.1 bifunctional folylpolyglutamate synthase/dihydrofolate synthase [Herbiconiux oxytropis]MCS5726373.1 bifunctional folylpolyglutamate synthase/dihydrofolate synthase [Herbiconiux oxytropis]
MSDSFFGGDFGPPADDPDDTDGRNGAGGEAGDGGDQPDEFGRVGLDAPDEFLEQGDAVYAALLARLGEASPEPRLSATRRVVELLGDPQRSYPVIHITGTNGKTSTSRIVESILRAHGLRTGLFTSPHLERLNERMMIDGVPISNEALAANWSDIEPFLELVDAELEAAGEARLTFFEALSVLAFASFADAPVDVAVIEVGMGGEWDSTNVADGQVAVITPISLDHTARLGNTVAEIARTKSGIVKPASQVVTAQQPAEALTELARAAELTESTFAVEGEAFRLLESKVAVGGQLVSVQGLAGTYRDIFLPLYGAHQGHNAAVAVAAVESFLGGGTQAIADDVITEGFATATSPGRLQLVGIEPTVLVDAAHNPGGASALAAAVGEYFTFDRVVAVIAVLEDKDVAGIVRALDPVVTEFVITSSSSDRAIDPDELASIVVGIAGADRVLVEPRLEDALDAARESASGSEKGAVLVTGSITLVGEVITRAAAEGWKGEEK